ncbi:P2X purinoceptor 7-like [Mizuhopecten yessoensis]|uniref:P2X purinoceptor 7-like n=1 Tax=Mizuhopecten yessoensis TaxID=6573 RepID=UPI000B45E463|nr:P2X purinoceptor 7-like [Mizuhopecten yessoensis]
MANNVTYVSTSESDEESVDLYMSDGSSNLEMDGTTYDGVTQPYMFEPETDDDPTEETSVADHEPEIQAIRLGSNDWCRCGHCPAMSTEVESICCKEVDQVMMDAIPGDLSCITLHPGLDAFLPVCFENEELEDNIYAIFSMQDNDFFSMRNRYIAYRQFVRWCLGWLGRHVRVRLPACAVTCIRNAFPAPDRQYNGFKFE